MLTPGSRLGPYEVISLLGAGGMGEVYRAADPTLKREVAVKVMPAGVSTTTERLGRFQREAELLASLNHPNIAQIYGAYEADGSTALVMELVAGEDLSERMARGPIPPDEAVHIGQQIANALEAAHEQGIIHRDLKPGNIKVRPDGTVKLLDFGLAKAMEPGGADAQAQSGGRTFAPTVTSPALITNAGMLLGTAAYMAPEQAKGRAVDRRADIWAFGVIVYEMVTGKPLFTADTVVETLAAVVSKTPDWSQVPARFRRLLKATLEPDPRRRLRDIGDAIRLLDDDEVAATVASSRQSPVLVGGLMMVALVASIVAGLAWVRRDAAVPARPLRLQVSLPPEAQPDFAMSLSPDGRRVAFVVVGADGARNAWVTDLETSEARPIRGADNLMTNPLFWSPDGRWLGFAAAGQIWKVNVVDGGDRLPIARSSEIGADWNAEGTIVFGTNPGRNAGGGIFRVPAGGGDPVSVTKVDATRGEYAHHHPTFLPDGRHFLYLRAARPESRSGIYVGSIDVGPDQQSAQQLVTTTYGPVFFSRTSRGDGHLFYLRNSSVVAQPFDPERLMLSGEPLTVASPVGSFIDRALFSVSRDGMIVHTTSSNVLTMQLTWADGGGKVLGTAGAPTVFSDAVLSPDGTRVAGTVLDLESASARNELWLWDLVRGTQGPIFNAEAALGPVWSRDNTRIAFAAEGDQGGTIYERAVNGLEEARLLFRGTSGERIEPTSWSPDGRLILFTRQTSETGSDIWVLSRDQGTATPLFRTAAAERDAQFSPDGRWIAYSVSEVAGQNEVHVTAVLSASPTLRVGGGPWRVSNGDGRAPRWRADGREIYYAGARSMMSVPVFTDSGFAVGSPVALPILGSAAGALGGRFGFVDASRDGKRFLYARPVDGGERRRAPLNILLNWSPPRADRVREGIGR